MKHNFLTIAILIFISGIINAQSAKPVNAKLQKVTVYVNGAHLYYTENINLVTGNNEFIFENISPYINEATLQASCKGGVITEVKHQLMYKEKPLITKKYDKEIQAVLDSIEDVNFDLQDIKNRFYVLETEKSMLLNNRIMKGQQLRDSLALLKDGLTLLRERLNSIYEQHLKLEKSKNKLTKRLNKLNERYSELQLLQSGQNLITNSQATNQVVINVFSDNNTISPITFNYFVNQANWIPQYDLQASSSGKLNIKYFGSLTQNTGVNWENVLLTLSTSNPTENNIKPTLNPWYLSYQQYIRKDKSYSNAQLELRSTAKSVVANNSGSDQTDDVDNNEDLEEKQLTDYIVMTENLIRTEYEINMKYSIKSDLKSHKVMINQKEVDMNLKFAAVPKICTDAFLMGKITGWEEMKIIPGTARVYFDGSFVGDTYLQASTTLDTLDIDLGKDKSLTIERKKIKEKFKTKYINDEKVETRTIEIVVRNTKNIQVDIVVEDQIPVVQGTKEIKVELLDADKGELDETSGILKWNIKLKSKEQKKIRFTYEITYPKNKTIAGL